MCVCVCVCVRVHARTHISQWPANLNSFIAVFILCINLVSVSSITFPVIQLFSYFIALSSPYMVY